MLTKLSSTRNCLFELHTTGKTMWDAPYCFYNILETRLRQLQMRFDSYNIDSKHPLAKHFRKISVVVRDLDAIGVILVEV